MDKISLPRAPGARIPGLIIAVGLHVALVAIVLNYAPEPVAYAPSSTIMVSFITSTPQVAKPVVVRIEPVKPKPQPKPRPKKTVVLSTASVAPAVFETAPPPPPPEPVAPPGPPQPVAPIIQPHTDASYLYNAIEYPEALRRARKQGLVRLRALISKQGTVSAVELLSSSGTPGLDTAALESVKKWKFVPGRQGDTPIEAWVEVPINYSLYKPRG